MNAINAARRARKLSLEDIAARTRISPRYVEAIDQERYSELPGGLYGRAYVRAVATVVGLGPEQVDEILPALAPAPDPIPVLEELHRPAVDPWPVFNGVFSGGLRLHLAATVDALVLLGLNLAVITIVAASCRVAPRTLLVMTPGPLLVLCASTWVIYFLLLAGVHGCTVGQSLCGVSLRHGEVPLRLTAILQRALGLGDGAVTTDGEGPGGLHRSTADPASPA
jgi:transcriptional regulator with XRE-family HTH domain